jgi:hypothetical protein
VRRASVAILVALPIGRSSVTPDMLLGRSTPP